MTCEKKGENLFSLLVIELLLLDCSPRGTVTIHTELTHIRRPSSLYQPLRKTCVLYKFEFIIENTKSAFVRYENQGTLRRIHEAVSIYNLNDQCH